MAGLKAHTDSCEIATKMAPVCARTCNKVTRKLSETPSAEVCASVSEKFKKECNERVAGTMVWHAGATQLAIGAAAILTASIALF